VARAAGPQVPGEHLRPAELRAHTRTSKVLLPPGDRRGARVPREGRRGDRRALPAHRAYRRDSLGLVAEHQHGPVRREGSRARPPGDLEALPLDEGVRVEAQHQVARLGHYPQRSVARSDPVEAHRAPGVEPVGRVAASVGRTRVARGRSDHRPRAGDVRRRELARRSARGDVVADHRVLEVRRELAGERGGGVVAQRGHVQAAAVGGEGDAAEGGSYAVDGAGHRAGREADLRDVCTGRVACFGAGAEAGAAARHEDGAAVRAHRDVVGVAADVDPRELRPVDGADQHDLAVMREQRDRGGAVGGDGDVAHLVADPDRAHRASRREVDHRERVLAAAGHEQGAARSDRRRGDGPRPDRDDEGWGQVGRVHGDDLGAQHARDEERVRGGGDRAGGEVVEVVKAERGRLDDGERDARARGAGEAVVAREVRDEGPAGGARVSEDGVEVSSGRVRDRPVDPGGQVERGADGDATAVGGRGDRGVGGSIGGEVAGDVGAAEVGHEASVEAGVGGRRFVAATLEQPQREAGGRPEAAKMKSAKHAWRPPRRVRAEMYSRFPGARRGERRCVTHGASW
jgi:hypothetical protein